MVLILFILIFAMITLHLLLRRKLKNSTVNLAPLQDTEQTAIKDAIKATPYEGAPVTVDDTAVCTVEKVLS